MLAAVLLVAVAAGARAQVQLAPYVAMDPLSVGAGIMGVADIGNGRALRYGGGLSSGTRTTELDRYDVATGTRTALNATGTGPPAYLSLSPAVYDAAADTFWVVTAVQTAYPILNPGSATPTWGARVIHGGVPRYQFSMAMEALSTHRMAFSFGLNLTVLDLANMTSTATLQVTGTGPRPRAYATSAVDDAGSRVFFFGGANPANGRERYSDLFELRVTSPTTASWREISAPGASARYGAVGAFAAGMFFVFGGITANPGAQAVDVDNAGTWLSVSAPGSPSPPLGSAGYATVSVGGEPWLVMLGGDHRPGLTTTYKLHLAVAATTGTSGVAATASTTPSMDSLAPATAASSIVVIAAAASVVLAHV
jgi:hypothetical protein